MFTIEQLQQDIDFLVNRSINAGNINFGNQYRDTGFSPNSIVAIAYGLDVTQKLPGDVSDLAACERMWKKLPEHRKTGNCAIAMDKARNCDYYGKDNYSPQQIFDLVQEETQHANK